MSQGQLSALMPDDQSQITLSFIETGKALPTLPYLEALCGVFDATPAELYKEEDLDLLGLMKGNTGDGVQIIDGGSDKSHSGMVEFRTWLRPHEKKNLESAINYLGYRNMAEWFREAYRSLIGRAMRIQNGGNTK